MSREDRSEAFRDPLGHGRRLKERLASGGTCAGVIMKIPSADMVDVLAGTDVDFVIADAEHGPIGPETCQGIVRAGDAAGIPVLARVGESSVPGTVTRFLDTGVAGVHVPHISSGPAARHQLSMLVHPMQGSRGLAAGRWARYGAVMPLRDQVEALAQSLVVVAQIEDEAAVATLEALLAIEDIDVYFIGPTDLAASMGLNGDKSDPRVQGLIDTAIDRIVGAGRTAGILAVDAADAERYRRLGVRYFVFNAESLVHTAVTAALAGIAQAIA